MFNVAFYRLSTAGCRIRAAPRANVVAMLDFRIPNLGFGRYLPNFVSVLRYVFTHRVLGLVFVLPFIFLLFSTTPILTT